MTWHLRDGLSYCLIDSTAIFLDLDADRYFRLDEAANGAFLRFVAGEDTPRLIQTLEAANVIVSAGLTRPVAAPILVAPLRRATGVTTGVFRLGDVAHALMGAKAFGTAPGGPLVERGRNPIATRKIQVRRP